MTQTYFLGANAKDGFASLYRFFPGAEDVFLHIIKGGPGTGKSGFMRRIGLTAEERGLDVHYVLCSGDPASLDGVYIPALRLAWVDGTAPHLSEPHIFGADSDYVNLGQFCRTPFREVDRVKLAELTSRHKRQYMEIYRALAQVQRMETEAPAPDALPTLPAVRAQPVIPAQRFLHAFSCEGEIFLWNEAKKLCKLIEPVSSAALRHLSDELEQRGLQALRCPSPLEPGELELVLLPWADRGYAAALAYRGLEPALKKLRSAKALHDEMEALVRPYMDFTALTAYTDKTLRDLFG